MGLLFDREYRDGTFLRNVCKHLLDTWHHVPEDISLEYER
jgi:hypothetical protein